MNVSVKVKPNSREEKIEKTGDGEFLLWVKSAPKDGRANQDAAKLLSQYFGVSKSSVALVRGYKSRNKIFSVTL